MIVRLVQLSLILISLFLFLLVPAKTLAFSGIDSNGLICSGPDNSCGDPPFSGICDSSNYWTCVGTEPSGAACTLRQSCGVVPTGVYCGYNGSLVDNSICGNTRVDCLSAGAFATCSITRSNGCMDCATPARFDCPSTPGGACVSDGGNGTGAYADPVACSSACPTPTPAPTATPTPAPVNYRCDTSNYTCVQDPNGNFSTSNCGGTCTPPGCTDCGTYTDTWSCPIAGQTKLCHTRVTNGNSCSSPEWSGACTSYCDACIGGPPPTPTPPPVGTPPPGTCLGSGANGCNDGSGRFCCPGVGLICVGSNPGTCKTIKPPPPYCEYAALGTPLQETPGYDSAGNPTSIPNWDPKVYGVDVTFNFNWTDLPPVYAGGGACSGSGRSFEIDVGLCQDGVTKYDPTKCTTSPYYTETTPNTKDWNGVWVGPGTPAGARFTIPQGCENYGDINGWIPQGANWGYTPNYLCTNQIMPPPFNGGQTHTYWYYIRADCACDGSFDPKFSPTYIFTYDYNNAPAAPTLVCQASNPSSGDANDICDLPTFGSPLGYGSGGTTGRHDLSGKNGAGGTAGSLTNRYTITDVTPGLTARTLPPATGPYNGVNVVFSLDTRTISNPPAPGGVGLENGHTYKWSVITSDSTTKTDSPPSPTWTFLNDTTPPDVSINDPNICFDTAGQPLPATIPVLTSDPGTPNLASNVKTVWAVVQNITAGGTKVYDQDITSTCTWNPPGNPGAGAGTCALPTNWATPSASGNIYLITVTSTDKAGNSNTAKNKLVYRNSCTGPWLQTKDGDVFTNFNVNAPGGPN